MLQLAKSPASGKIVKKPVGRKDREPTCAPRPFAKKAQPAGPP